MMVSILALLLASAAFLFYDIATFKSERVNELQILAEIIGNNSTAAISFNDKETGREILSSLKAKTHIISAFILVNGMPMAGYFRDKIGSFHPVLQAQGDLFLKNLLVVSHDINFKNKKLGSVYIESDLGEIHSRLKQYFMAIVIIALMVFIIVFFIASKVERTISDPILQLSKIAKNVTETENYSIEVKKHSNDEIGELFDEFNKMMKRIQLRDLQLTETKIELEIRVQERTKELNARLFELEQFNKVTTGRELQMIELKKEINRISREFHLKEPYDLSFLKE